MTFTSINPATAVISGGTISKAGFGDLVCANFDDHETRIEANESDIRGASNAVTNIRDTHGRWYSTSTSTFSTTETALPFTNTEDTPTGVTYASGVFTIATAGRYDISANLHGTFSTNTSGYVGLSIGVGVLKWGYQLSWINSAATAPTVVMNIAASGVTFSAGGTFSVFGITTAGTVTLAGATTHGTNVGIQRVG